MGGVQRTGAGSKTRIPSIVSKSGRAHGSATTADRTLGLPPAGTISRSNLCLGLYPIHTNRRPIKNMVGVVMNRLVGMGLKKVAKKVVKKLQLNCYLCDV